MADAPSSVRVLVVDDSAQCREALGSVVAATTGFTLAGSCASGEDALDLLSDAEPDLVLLDVRMPGLGGPEVARRIGESRPEVAVVLVSAYAESVPAASSCGAAAVLSKSDVSPRLLAEVWRAAAVRHAARERVEEAQALRAQAEHQLRRAARNLVDGSSYRPADSDAPSPEDGSSSGTGKQTGHSRS